MNIPKYKFNLIYLAQTYSHFQTDIEFGLMDLTQMNSAVSGSSATHTEIPSSL